MIEAVSDTHSDTMNQMLLCRVVMSHMLLQLFKNNVFCERRFPSIYKTIKCVACNTLNTSKSKDY